MRKFVIRANDERDEKTGHALYWSITGGWVDLDSATVYTGDEVLNKISGPVPAMVKDGGSWMEII